VKTILVVDDEIGTAEIVSQLLCEEGYAATYSANGAAGLAQAQAQVPDLVIADFMMPVMNGADFVQALHADPRFSATKIILNSGLPEELVGRDTADYHRFLRKPFPMVRLLELVEELIGPATD